jgi:hypothetical protein
MDSMNKKFTVLLLLAAFLLGACGDSAEPATAETPEIIIPAPTPTEPPEPAPLPTPEPTPTPTEPEKEGIIEQKILEPLIIIQYLGWDIFTNNIRVSVVSLCGIVKSMEYETEDWEVVPVKIGDPPVIDIQRLTSFVYNQMNDDSIPVVAQLDRIPDEIIELGKIVETLDLDKFVGLAAGNWVYYIIIEADEDKRAIMIGDRKGHGIEQQGGNELTRMINEYLKPIIGRVLY